ncbi:MAG: aspartate--tRNA(Asn) ligase [Nitrososphaerota archaeon]|nr:aspartate--tRNA(Asn) ligase [Candidatus Bathyarchaeota archaeon]MDW8062452.1 aspartate--tRNA(Asn) ligase [Nitrososphaerota archaeon]
MTRKISSRFRSYYSVELGKLPEGSRVSIAGYVVSVRLHGGVIFFVVYDGGYIQCVAHMDEVDGNVWGKMLEIREYFYVSISGRISYTDRAPSGVEVVMEDAEVIAKPVRMPPFHPYSRRLPSLDKRLDLRAVDLRRPQLHAIFKVRHEVLQAMRRFLVARGFLEVNTPKIIASATEGGAALFPLFYYDKEAFLAQSPQLYKEQLSAALDRVFEIAPIFRAEEFKTDRHLSETLSLDVEMAFADYRDVMNLLEDLVAYIVNSVKRYCAAQLAALDLDIPKVRRPFKRISYDRVISKLRELGLDAGWGEDLSTTALRKLAEVYREPYFIVDWPRGLKPFYIKSKRGGVTESFDLMWGHVELASGGSRVDSKRSLIRNIRMQGLNPESFEYHLRVFDYGMPPHAGFGLGVDRLIMVLTSRDDIREVVFYPRDPSRLTP